MSLLLERERLAVAAACRRMLDTGLVVNTSGNISVRVGEHVVITPSGCAYDALHPEDILVLDLKGEIVEGDLVPSSETPLHLSVYDADADTRAVVHTHSLYATAVSTLVEELPAVHYQVTDLGGPVPVAPYRTFGTPELAAAVTGAIRGRTAALMQNHGALTVGETLDKAFARAITLEWLSRLYLVASQSGSPRLIDNAELERVRAQQQRFGDEQRQRLAARHKADGNQSSDD